MSADGHTVCPACHPDLADYTGHDGVIDNAAEDKGYDRPVRENYEFAFKRTETGLVLSTEYYAECWDCGWHFGLARTDPLTGL